MRISDRFTSCWIGFGLHGVREVPTTYDGVDPAKLPALPPAGADWSWLAGLPAEVADAGMADSNHLLSHDELRERAESLRRSAPEAAPEGVPEALWELLTRRDLQERIPSCTACYFDLPDAWCASPFREGDFMLRFMNDQQCCFCWYLYLAKDEAPFVVAGSGIGEEVFLEEVDFTGESGRLDEAWQATFRVAGSFHEFIHRFWLENVIWFKLDDGLELSTGEISYLRQIDPGYDPAAEEQRRAGKGQKPAASGSGSWLGALWERWRRPG